MPFKPWPDNLREELRRLWTRRTWTEPRPVYLATGLIVMAAVLMLVVVSGVRQPAGSVPTVPQARREAPLEPAVRPEAPARLAVSPVTEPVVAPPQWDGRPHRPVTGEIAGAFGWQLHQVYGDWRYHPGVDITAPAGDTVKAIWGGRVSEIYADRQYGLTVAVTGNGYTVYYGSLAAIRVDKTQQLAPGAPVGVVGEAPGERYPHLHLALKSGDKYVDPAEFLAKSE